MRVTALYLVRDLTSGDTTLYFTVKMKWLAASFSSHRTLKRLLTFQQRLKDSAEEANA